jgi:glycosyltransferase A (GT-A) superfamily protein (DUF2064 family)
MGGVRGQSWVLLVYTMPREPTAPRVAVWRKLKKLGALRLHDAAWALPASDALVEQVRWLAEEIREGEGETLVWQAQGDTPAQDDQLIDQFVAQAERGYQALLEALDQPGANAAELARRYRQIRGIDYFHAPSAEKVWNLLTGTHMEAPNKGVRDGTGEAL